jgi:hypothetical protein
MHFLEEEHRLALETRKKYRGTASVKLEVLHFAYEEDAENVTRLKRFFRKNGCNRLDIRNHIPAIINQEQLDIAIEYSKISAKALMASSPTDPRGSYPTLSFPPEFRLKCLHGLDRVRAGADILPPGEKHWTVDFYLEGSKHPSRVVQQTNSTSI